MNPEIFGPPTWIWLFYLALMCTTDEEKDILLSILKDLQILLPCSTCRTHLKYNMDTHDPQRYCKNKENLFYYIYLLKTLADNNRPVYSPPPFQEVKRKYMHMSERTFADALWKSLFLLAKECQDKDRYVIMLRRISKLAPSENMRIRMNNFIESVDISNPERYIERMKAYIEN